MKRTMTLPLALILAVIMLPACSLLGNEPAQGSMGGDSAGVDASTPEDRQPLAPDVSAETYIAADEARAMLQAWVENHPFQLGAALEPESDEHSAGGKAYYRFYLGVVRFGIIEILADKETGALYHCASPGNDAFEPLDAYYEREHKDY